jgi:hypothetical protein
LTAAALLRRSNTSGVRKLILAPGGGRWLDGYMAHRGEFHNAALADFCGRRNALEVAAHRRRRGRLQALNPIPCIVLPPPDMS